VTNIWISPTVSDQVAKQLSRQPPAVEGTPLRRLPGLEESLLGKRGLTGFALDRFVGDAGGEDDLGDVGDGLRRIGADEYRVNMRVGPLCQRESRVEK
jgi:hypothetical protein